MHRSWTVGTAVLLGLCATSVPHAGVFVRSTGTRGSGEVATEISLDATAVRVDSGGEARGHTVIYRREEQLFWIIDHRKKTYMEMTRQELQETVARLSGPFADARKMIDAQLANVPPEQRKMMEDMLRGKMPPGMDLGAAPTPPEYRKVESGVEVGSWTCDRYEGVVDGEKVAEVWTARPAALGIADADLEALREVSAFLEDLVKAAGEAFPPLRGLAGATGGFEGLPLKQVGYDGGRETSRQTVEEIRNRSFDAALFARPTGYTKKEPFKELGGQ